MTSYKWEHGQIQMITKSSFYDEDIPRFIVIVAIWSIFFLELGEKCITRYYVLNFETEEIVKDKRLIKT